MAARSIRNFASLQPARSGTVPCVLGLSRRLFVLFPALPVSNDLVAYSGFCELLSVFLQLALMPAVTRPVVRVDPAGYEAVKLSAPLPLTLRTRLLPEDNLNDSRDAFLAAIHQWAAGLACPGLDDRTSQWPGSLHTLSAGSW